jgi:glucose/arabinose dehydrogenase/regulation of enolase protein 1 (concanavalin A-like superfamily)
MRTLLITLLALPLAMLARAQAQPYGLETRPAFTAYHGTLPATAPTFSGTWTAVVAFPNLTFLNPMGMIPVPGTNKLAVHEREGRVYTFDNVPSTAAKTLVLDVSNRCQGWDDSGLMGIAYHPNFAVNRYLFVYYTWVTPGTVQGNQNARPPTNLACRDRLSRFTCNAAGVADPASETVFIDQVSNSVWHNGGGMFFHPVNGFLYLTNGDDSNGGNSQRINTGLHSGVLRIDVDRRGGAISHAIPRQPLPAGSVTANYFIPNDNPFVGQANVLEEFWALGLRSPHRMTIDPPTGRIFIGDVGAGTKEEITAIEPADPSGVNMQWDRIEGLNGDLTGTYIGVNKRPIIDYGRTDGSAVIGGYVYRGTEFASDLYGKYIFGDNIRNTVWYLDESTTPPVKRAICTLPYGPGPNAGSDYTGLSSFGYDQNNEIYMCQLSSTAGRIFKFSRTGPPPVALPQTLTSTGLFSSLASLTPANGFIKYDVNSPLWSDGAAKSRWMAIPTGTQIGYAAEGNWTFPAGSVWLKHFDLPISDTNPALRRRLETRVLVRNSEGYVYGASYKWRPDNSEADLVETGVTEDIPVAGSVPMSVLTSVDIGAPAAGATTLLPDGYQITAGGADIWGNADSFRFAYEMRTGNFDVATRLESLTQPDLYTKAGLMARESLAAGSRHVLAMVFPSNAARNNNVGGYEFQSRDTTNGLSTALYPPAPQPLVSYPDTWVRLKRDGDVFTGYSSTDGTNWTVFATKTLTLPQTLFFGAAVTSHNAGLTTVAKFHFPKADRKVPWLFPGRSDCLSCHTQPSGGVLGVHTGQSNRELLYTLTGITDNQLRTWNHIGLLNPALPEAGIPALQKMASLSDPAATLEAKARSYLDSNCAHCHQPGGVNAFWDGRYETPLANSGIINGTVQNILGVTGSKVVVPRDLSKSIMHRRMNTATEPYKMPPIAKSQVDPDGVKALADWINSLNVPTPQQLPAPWLHAEVGTPALAGDATWTSGVFSISGSGDDIWNNADSFHYVYQPLNGDGQITAHIQSVANTDAWAKSGVMIRESLTTGSAHAFCAITAGQGAAFQRRQTTDGTSAHSAGAIVAAPYWVRLRRDGNLISAYISDVGDTWTLVGTDTIPMAASVYIGLAVTSHNNAALSSTAIDSVNVTGGVSGTALNINFQLAGAPVPAGYLEDGGAVFGVRGNGFSYGWNIDNSANHRDRNVVGAPDQRYDTLAHMQKPGGPFFWEIMLPNGRYSVHAVGGDPANADGVHHLLAESTTIYNASQTGANNYVEGTAEVSVTDGRLTLSPGPSGVNTKLCFVDIISVAAGVQTALTTPAVGASFVQGTAIPITATATTTAGTITLVEFFNGLVKIGEASTAPYTMNWSGVPAGSYTLTARATDSSSQSATSAARTITVTSNDPRGLEGRYFPTMTLSGTPVLRMDATVDFDWGGGPPLAGIGADAFSVRWTGRVQPSVSGDYIFTTESDDGVRLRINGVLVINQWIDQGPTLWSSAPIPLIAGQFYDVEMEYYENGGGAVARLSWQGPGFARQIIPNALLYPPTAGNRPPRAPLVNEPAAEGQLVNPADAHMEATAFSDPNPGDIHLATDWEIWTVSPLQRVWITAGVTGVERLHTHLGDGTFENSHAGRLELLYDTNYQLRVRFRDSSGHAATEWGGYGVRNFRTTSVTDPIPGAPGWNVRQPDYKVEQVAGGLQLPVNIAFANNPGPNPGDLLCYVTELYGTIKAITRDGTVSDYATGLLNFNPTGNFPGSGEQGLTGIAVHPATGDVYAAMLYSSQNGVEGVPHYPKVMRFQSTNGGRTASSQSTILDMSGETQGQSHQVSNLTIGPDGFLYLHMGDGFDSTTGQNLASYRGKILRFTTTGAAVPANPFYNAADGITARDYVFSYGLRNPFGGAWRAADGAHYFVENGPSVDRIAKSVSGRNYLWDGSDASMSNFAIYNWNPASGPVNMAFTQTSTFGGSGFPAGKMDHLWISESGATWASGPQTNGKRISGFVLDAAGNRISGPTPLVEYNSTGKASVVALTAGPDGLYFSDFYRDSSYTSPIDRGSNLLRVRYAPPLPWNTWRTATFTPAEMAAGEITGDQDDPDNDGLSNLLEYALKLLPKTPNALPATTTSPGTGSMVLTFTRNAAAPDIAFVLQESTSLNGWQDLVVAPVITPLAGGIENATYTIPKNTQRKFVRLTVRLVIP